MTGILSAAIPTFLETTFIKWASTKLRKLILHSSLKEKLLSCTPKMYQEESKHFKENLEKKLKKKSFLVKENEKTSFFDMINIH